MVITPISSFSIENKALDNIDMYSDPAGSYVRRYKGSKTISHI